MNLEQEVIMHRRGGWGREFIVLENDAQNSTNDVGDISYPFLSRRGIWAIHVW